MMCYAILFFTFADDCFFVFLYYLELAFIPKDFFVSMSLELCVGLSSQVVVFVCHSIAILLMANYNYRKAQVKFASSETL